MIEIFNHLESLDLEYISNQQTLSQDISTKTSFCVDKLKNLVKLDRSILFSNLNSNNIDLKFCKSPLKEQGRY